MSFPRPTPTYDAQDQAKTRELTWNWLQKARQKGQDVEIAGNERLILTDTVTNLRGVVTVASGVVMWMAL